jgi:hypothetical protein
MTPQLSDDQRSALRAHGGSPISVIDTQTNTNYVLLRADAYEQLRAFIEEEHNPSEAYPFVDRVLAEDDANDPTIAGYQDEQSRGSR